MATKRIVIVRHGEGQHQLRDRNFARDLGPGLTQKGKAQAKAVAHDPVFARALASAERPLFVSSNLVRAVETMALAAPDHRVIVQPHARELIKGSNDFPSSLEALDRWAQKSGVELDLGPYCDALQANGQPNFTSYVRSLCEVDCTIMPPDLSDNIETWAHIVATFGRAFRKGLATLPARVNQLMRWLAEQDADIVFMTSHGDFLNYGIEGIVDGSPTEDSWDNCEVREFSLVAVTDNYWRLRRGDQDLTMAVQDVALAPASVCVSALVRFTEEMHLISTLPRVFVFDLDDTIWRGDLDQTAGPPFTLDESGKLLSPDGTGVTPFADVPEIFSWIEENGHVAALASAGGQEIKWRGRDTTENALRLITTRSGRTLADIMLVRRIHFTKSKEVTLTEIAVECGCKPADMVFFDNSMGRVQEALAAGITSCFCPYGLTFASFVRCTKEFARCREMGEGKATYVDGSD